VKPGGALSKFINLSSTFEKASLEERDSKPLSHAMLDEVINIQFSIFNYEFVLSSAHFS
jgi:hypothetical protein